MAAAEPAAAGLDANLAETLSAMQSNMDDLGVCVRLAATPNLIACLLSAYMISSLARSVSGSGSASVAISLAASKNAHNMRCCCCWWRVVDGGASGGVCYRFNGGRRRWGQGLVVWAVWKGSKDC